MAQLEPPGVPSRNSSELNHARCSSLRGRGADAKSLFVMGRISCTGWETTPGMGPPQVVTG